MKTRSTQIRFANFLVVAFIICAPIKNTNKTISITIIAMDAFVKSPSVIYVIPTNVI